MTFEKFEEIVKEFRPELKVSQHGSFCTNDSKNTLGIIFKKGGKVYNFSGTYLEIINQLGIEITSQKTIDYTVNKILKLKSENGKLCLLTKKPIDNTRLILVFEKELEEMKSRPIFNF